MGQLVRNVAGSDSEQWKRKDKIANEVKNENLKHNLDYEVGAFSLKLVNTISRCISRFYTSIL